MWWLGFTKLFVQGLKTNPKADRANETLQSIVSRTKYKERPKISGAIIKKQPRNLLGTKTLKRIGFAKEHLL